MKYGLLLLITGGILLFSCNQNADNAAKGDGKDNPIVGKWKLQSMQNKQAESDKINLSEQPTQVILSILDGGYFVLYDTFTDPRFNQKGFSRISEISKGQWEFIDNKKLVLHHNNEDTTLIEELEITLLNKNTLVTKGKNKKSSIYKTYQGY